MTLNLQKGMGKRVPKPKQKGDSAIDGQQPKAANLEGKPVKTRDGKHAKTTDRPERFQNPAAVAVWKDWERFKVFEQSATGLNTTHPQMAAQAKIMNCHKAELHTSCVYLALASFLSVPGLVRLGKCEWGSVQPDRLLWILERFAAPEKAMVMLWRAVETNGSVTLTSKSYRFFRETPVKRWNFLLADGISSSGVLTHHLLPFCDPHGDLPVEAGVLYPAIGTNPSALNAGPQAPEVGAKCFMPYPIPPEEPEFVPKPAPAGVLLSKKGAVSGFVGKTSEDRDTLVPEEVGNPSKARVMTVDEAPVNPDNVTPEELEAIRLMEQAPAPSSPVESSTEGLFYSDSQSSPKPIPTKGTAFERYLENCTISGYAGATSLAYQGVWEPVEGTWVGGWWSSTFSVEKSAPSIIPTTPDLASATADQASVWADSIKYLPIPAAIPGCHLVGDRTLADGHHSVQYFKAGDTVVIDRREYSVREEVWQGLSVLALHPAWEPTCITRAFLHLFYGVVVPLLFVLGGLIGLGPIRSLTVVRNHMGFGFDEETKKRADYALLGPLVAKESAAAFGNLKNQAATRQYGADAPCPYRAFYYATHEGKFVQATYGITGGKPYPWGAYCYSCDRQLPGTFPGRLCGRCVEPASAALIRDGHHVTSIGDPVVYPGVVTTESRHPPMKAGKETVATPQCFRVAP